MMFSFNRFRAGLAGGLCLLSGPALAHAGDQGFVLLLPTTFYATTGTLSVIASMVLVTVLRRGATQKIFRPILLGTSPISPKRRLMDVSSVIASIFLFGLIGIGLFGPTDPQNNLLPLVFWTIWWMLLYTVQAVLFDIWRWINPWSGLSKLLRLGEEGVLTAPTALGVLPAIVLFLSFQGFLLADIAPNDPKRLAYIILLYWSVTLIGIATFGRRYWLNNVECLTVVFNMLSLLRPIALGDKPRIGLPGWKAVQPPLAPLSVAALCLSVLAAGSFDGLNETFWWLVQIGVNPLEFPGRSAVIHVTLAGLIGSVAALFFVFALSVQIGVMLARRFADETRLTFAECFRGFALTLLPIALGYHVAHYLVSFLVQIRVTLSTAADPLARGWDLLGLSAVKVTTGFLNTPETVKVIWLSQAGVVIISHILAVLMSHRLAEQFCATGKGVVLIQIGISVLMVAYTVFGLWLLASPRGA